MLKAPSSVSSSSPKTRTSTLGERENGERRGLENYRRLSQSPKATQLKKDALAGKLSPEIVQDLLAGRRPSEVEVNINKPVEDAAKPVDHLKVSELSDALIRLAVGNRSRHNSPSNSPTREAGLSRSSTPVPSSRKLESKKDGKSLDQFA